MAKYNRHDPRNKKKNKHKNMAKQGRDLRFHRVKQNGREFAKTWMDDYAEKLV